MIEHLVGQSGTLLGYALIGFLLWAVFGIFNLRRLREICFYVSMLLVILSLASCATSCSTIFETIEEIKDEFMTTSK